MPASDPPPTSSEFTRLHITPLDAELLKVIIPASSAPNVRNISYHTIETFPEKRYGFVDLPVADAEKLRTKLHGAILKGAKMRIEKARPETTMELGEAAETLPKKEKKEKKKSKDKEGSKKRKRDVNFVDGVDLGDRKVQRGWTETTDEVVKRKKKDRSEKSSKSKEADDDKKPKDKGERKRTKTKYTDGAECLLKTQIPSNKDLRDKDKADKKRRKRGNEREVTVHEFEKTTRFPTFLKDSGSKEARAEAEYVEGKGWVDDDGNVVEAVVEKKPKKVKKEKKEKEEKKPKKTPTPEPESDSDTSSSGTSSEDESEVEEKPTDSARLQPKPAPAADSDSDTSSEGSSDEDEPEKKAAGQSTPISKGDNARPESSASSRSLTIKIPPPDASPSGEVHPLEALYKRKKSEANTTETPAGEAFSFFAGENDDNEEESESNDQDEAPVPPMTPFTKQDYEWRNARSAAPTPDTAHPSRMQNLWASQNDDEDEMDDVEEEEEGDEDAQASTGGDRATSDFQNWFWENRRELNQSWMKRRKTVAKEKRHRENKARASRAV